MTSCSLPPQSVNDTDSREKAGVWLFPPTLILYHSITSHCLRGLWSFDLLIYWSMYDFLTRLWTQWGHPWNTVGALKLQYSEEVGWGKTGRREKKEKEKVEPVILRGYELSTRHPVFLLKKYWSRHLISSLQPASLELVLQEGEYPCNKTIWEMLSDFLERSNHGSLILTPLASAQSPAL